MFILSWRGGRRVNFRWFLVYSLHEKERKAFFLHGVFQLMSNWLELYYINYSTMIFYLILAILVVLYTFVSFFFSWPSSHCPMIVIHFTGKEKYLETQDKGEKIVLLHGIVGGKIVFLSLDITRSSAQIFLQIVTYNNMR